jgi:hypothetical protein
VISNLPEALAAPSSQMIAALGFLLAFALQKAAT